MTSAVSKRSLTWKFSFKAAVAKLSDDVFQGVIIEFEISEYYSIFSCTGTVPSVLDVGKNRKKFALQNINTTEKMTSPLKLRKMAQKANASPKWNVSGDLFFQMKRKFETNSAIRKCLRQLKKGAKSGQTQLLIYNFKFGYEEGRLWTERLFDYEYMSDVNTYLRKKGFTTSEFCTMNNIPKKWKEMTFSPNEELTRITDPSFRCILVNFGNEEDKSDEISTNSGSSY